MWSRHLDQVWTSTSALNMEQQLPISFAGRKVERKSEELKSWVTWNSYYCGEMMKITKQNLRTIIREEMGRLLEAKPGDGELEPIEAELLQSLTGDAVEDALEDDEEPGVDLRGIKVTPQSIARLKDRMRRTTGHISGPRTKDVPVGMRDPRTGKVRTK